MKQVFLDQNYSGNVFIFARDKRATQAKNNLHKKKRI